MQNQVDAAEKPSRLVISAATGYTPDALEPFLRSLYEHCPSATVVLMVNEYEQRCEEVLKSFNENVVLISLPHRHLRKLLWNRHFLFCWERYEIWRYGTVGKAMASTEFFSRLLGRQFTTSFLPIVFTRYFIAKELLLNRFQEAKYVLLCDSRDVFFQGDPFSDLPADLLSGLEDRKIKECPWTRQWVDRNYGDEGLKLIGEQQVVCAGVTLGERSSILAYLETMCNEISKHLLHNAFRPNGDQGIHNWIIRQNSMNCFLIPNGHRLIATLNYSDVETLYHLDEKSGLLNKKLESVVIVHQYDRKESISNWCLKRWAKNSLKRQEVVLV